MCSPSSGGERSKPKGALAKFSGLTTCGTLPAGGCGRSRSMRRWRTCGSSKTSGTVLIGEHGTPAASSLAARSARPTRRSARESSGSAPGDCARAPHSWRSARPSAIRACRSPRIICANWPSLPTASTTWPSAQAKTSCGWMLGWRLPPRFGVLPGDQPVHRLVGEKRGLHVEHGEIDVSPSPVSARRASAARTATAAYMPVMMSTIGTPTFCGPPPG